MSDKEISSTEKWWIDYQDIKKMEDRDELWRLRNSFEALNTYLFGKVMKHLRGKDASVVGSMEWLHHAAMQQEYQQELDKERNMQRMMSERHLELNKLAIELNKRLRNE